MQSSAPLFKERSWGEVNQCRGEGLRREVNNQGMEFC